MKKLVLVFAFLLFTYIAFAAPNVPLDPDGTVPGSPFQALQDQIDAIPLTPGPTGPAGATGATGATGVDGPAGVNAPKWVVRDANGQAVGEVVNFLDGGNIGVLVSITGVISGVTEKLYFVISQNEAKMSIGNESAKILSGVFYTTTNCSGFRYVTRDQLLRGNDLQFDFVSKGFRSFEHSARNLMEVIEKRGGAQGLPTIVRSSDDDGQSSNCIVFTQTRELIKIQTFIRFYNIFPRPYTLERQ